MNANDASTVIALGEATDPRWGGKARGLARLLAAGLRVPPGFVSVGASRAALSTAYAELGAGMVAVRSSAAAEDGDDSSYAGVFESVLFVEGEDALLRAVERCLASGSSARVNAYEGAGGAGASGMAVIVQRMVDARAAGVLFTRDPLSGAADRWVIEAIPGVGEDLVSGRARPDRYIVGSEKGERIEQTLAGHDAVLDAETLHALVTEASRLAAARAPGLDMEWAIDDAGQIHWLQARPITKVGGVDLGELDSPIVHPTPGFTRYNVGEILPGAITPLTATTTVEMIDRGFCRAYERFGVFDEADPSDCFVAIVSGHLFMNMRAPYLFAAKIGGGSKVEADRSLGGRVFDELEGLPARGSLSRTVRATRVVLRLRRAGREVERVEQGLERFSSAPPNDSALALQLARIEELVRFGAEIGEAHVIASTWSGMLYGVLQGMITGGEPPNPEQSEALAGLLCGVGRVESAEIGPAMQALADAIQGDDAARSTLEQVANDQACLAWLRSPEAGVAGQRFDEFLRRHGHRCVRELELRERDWAEDPLPLVAVLRASINGHNRRANPTPLDPATLKIAPRTIKAVRWILPKVCEAVRLRERCKSLLVRCARLIKRACLAVGEELVVQGRLPELDRIYFLRRSELARLADPRLAPAEAQALARLAVRRRHAFTQQQGLRFAMVCAGRPQPRPFEPAQVGVRRLLGTSVSPGVVEGLARVATSPSEAALLVAGEILIVPFTDAGWSPYFNLAAGLATEIGGTLSHGAVVARELGLPAVVDLGDATTVVRTGQRVRLDANLGTLELLD